MEDAFPQEARAFDRLPPSVIENILYAVDANTFASLALLSQKWRQVSESKALYAHHLSQCPSFLWSRAVLAPPTEADELSSLKRQFVEEIRRNAFDVFLRPRKTLVRLISSSMSSSTAFPQGEVFRFSFSANGHMALCISSSRIVVLEVAADPVSVKHELQTRRRPLGATILDDGSLLAVVSESYKVNIYKLTNNEAKRIQTITLNDAPRDLIFSPTGSVLALSFEDNIEVHAIGEETLATERRAARCTRVDALQFTPDGSMVLGSSVDHEIDGIVTITAPFYTETGTDASPEEVQMRMWTTQILFPELARGFTHACLISEHYEGDDSWILGYDIQLAAFRAIQVNRMDAGGVYFSSPFLTDESREMMPTMFPSIDEAGELAALGFQDSEVWLYGLPKRLDVVPTNTAPESTQNTTTRFGGVHHCAGSEMPRDNLAQLDKIIQQSKLLVRGRRVTDLQGITSTRWVHSASSIKPWRRLVSVAPGGVRPQLFGEEDVPVDGGRVLILDFERSTTNGEEFELDIEVGETPPKMLQEPDSSLDTEVELQRRRTRLVRHDTDATVAGLRTRQSTRVPSIPVLDPQRHDSLIPATTGSGPNSNGVVDIPYDNTQPRSQEVLHRAATAAASTRGRYDPRYRSTPSGRYVPHESDADNWVPPPPPYQREPDGPLPDHLRQTLMPNVSGAGDFPNRPSSQNFLQLPSSPVQRAQTARVPRTNPSDRPRPQSAIIQRLGTITGNLRAGRARRDSSAAGDALGQESLDIPPVPAIPAAQAATALPPLPAHLVAARPSTASPVVPITTGHIPFLQPLPTLTVQPAQPRQQADPPIPPLGATLLGENYFSYASSSPNLLHIPQPHGNALDLSAEDEEIPARQRSFRRRVSTEPTSLPPPENEEWRRRIEDWNEHTIRERGRKRKNKCLVM
ncbi:hypothetical protein N7478_003369 [Penicillium angulare]|uniref:uncharacterized protein n=1 Tax=Penicillium angulare TaxID=116970 RepID=UPI0025400A10|nr:uncharacterized protein N7478_003369 [Penicillium angulare]KAJ5287683.1 hypothetical protein N7478_003369 [Penicillium angulare]